ncbi:hypothetical protein STAS_35497 [Striga asiatica]|uniref:Uncharacterized protein n=1 Tax=Striga asiatica TaxID=4170 RepID=A0A5A7RKP6_STRAF|nr:hypothetical protein STAS_35497 [Striga asiatica]
MAQLQHTQRHRRRAPSFSSTLLDAIYRSIDGPEESFSGPHARPARVEHEIESLRRAIKIEKSHTTTSSHSGSSTDSSIFSSSSETEPSSARNPKLGPANAIRAEPATPKRESRFTRTVSRALKIYGDLKSNKNPGSPGGRIAGFLNSIFSPRRSSRAPLRKSRSVKDQIDVDKRTRAVRFCHVSAVLDEDSRAGGPGRFIVKDADGRRRSRGCGEDEGSDDDGSCASSDLFELENIGRAGIYEEELPVYGTTSVTMNRAIATTAATNHRCHRIGMDTLGIVWAMRVEKPFTNSRFWNRATNSGIADIPLVLPAEEAAPRLLPALDV